MKDAKFILEDTDIRFFLIVRRDEKERVGQIKTVN